MKTLTVRLPEDLYLTTTLIAQKRGVSLNGLVQEGLARLIREEKAIELYEAFSLVGEDAEESSVEFAVAAQLEVVKDEPTPSEAR